MLCSAQPWLCCAAPLHSLWEPNRTVLRAVRAMGVAWLGPRGTNALSSESQHHPSRSVQHEQTKYEMDEHIQRATLATKGIVICNPPDTGGRARRTARTQASRHRRPRCTRHATCNIQMQRATCHRNAVCNMPMAEAATATVFALQRVRNSDCYLRPSRQVNSHDRHMPTYNTHCMRYNLRQTNFG